MITPLDITETRRNPHKLSMRFPSDPETARRLDAVRKLQLVKTEGQLPPWRRVLRRVRGIG